MSLHDILPPEDLSRLMEDSGLTAQEIATQYEMAVNKAKADSAPKKAVNRHERRAQEQKVRQLLKLNKDLEASRPVNERFAELPDDRKIEIYSRILDRVRQKNDEFERMKERDANGENLGEGSTDLPS